MCQLHFSQQTEQANEYWLISFQLSCSLELPVNYFIEIEGQRLQLFQQNHQTALFLAQSPIKQPQKALKTFENHQAWLFWQDFKAQIDLANPILLKAENLNIATLLLLAKKLQTEHQTQVIALLYTETLFPFIIKPAQILFPDFPAEAIAACPLLEDWKIPNRLCSSNHLPGCFDGDFTNLARFWQPPEHWQTFEL